MAACTFRKEGAERRVLISSLWSPATGHEGMEWNEAASGEVQVGQKVLHCEGGWSLEQSSQGHGHSTEPVRVVERLDDALRRMV